MLFQVAFIWIIPLKINVVNYGENGSKTTWIDKLKSDLPIITTDFKNFVSIYKDVSPTDLTNGWVAYAKSIGNTDKELLKFLSDVDSGNRKIEEIDSYMNQASSSTAKFGATLKSVAANMAIMLAINVGIKLLAKAWDTLNVTVKEQETKINELKSSYEGLKSEYDDLSQKQDITDAEKRRLEYLERRLELDERILKAEQAQLFEEKTGKKFTDLFDADNLNTQYLKEVSKRTIWGGYENKDGYSALSDFYNDKTNEIENIHIQIKALKELQATVEEGSVQWKYYQNSIDSALNKETKYIDQLSEKENQMTINLGKYADNIEYLQSQLDSGDLTSDQETTAKEELAKWQNLYDETDAMITQIQKLNGTYNDTAEQVSGKYSAELNKAKTYLGGYDYNDRGSAATNETGRQLADFWDENVLSGTDEEIEQNIALWEKVTEGINDATEAMEAYIEAKKNGIEISADSEPVSFDQAWADSFTSENDEVKKLGDTLLDLAEKGRLTKEIFEESDSTGYFKNLGISADEAVEKINKLVDESKQLSSMSSQISSMSEALATKKSNHFVDADTLAGFDVEVRGLESWDRFQEVLGSTTSSYKECQEAANALATEWVNSSDFLAQLTEQKKEYYETQLEAMGIENYEEMIDSTLALKEAKEALADVDLSGSTYDDIEALISEGEYSELVAEQIWSLYAAKLAEQATSIDSSADCAQLLNLTNDANFTAEAIRLLTELMSIYSGLESGVYSKSGRDREYAFERAAQIKSELDALANGENKGLIIEPTVKLGNKGKSSAKSAGKSAGKSLKDGLKEELSNLDSIISGITKAIDRQISGIKAQKDAALDAIEAEKKAAAEALEAEKAQVQEKIDAKQAEIDAIEDAAKARKNEIDLQKAQYDLERMQNQRTMLVNYMPDTIVI